MNSLSLVTPRFVRITSLLIVVLSVIGIDLEGHAILRSSSPAVGGSVSGPELPVKLTFNVRVDAARSKLQLLMPDASTVELPIIKGTAPDTLVSKLTGLK